MELEHKIVLNKLKLILSQMPDLLTFDKSNPTHTQWIGRAIAVIRIVNANDAFKFEMAANTVGVDLLKESSYTEMRSILEVVIATVDLQNLEESKTADGTTAVDSTTGLLDRKSFDEALKNNFAIAQAEKILLGLIFVDVDRFKTVNDTHGHQKGDQVLAEVSRRLVLSSTGKGSVSIRR
ncbi:MAG: GGDEF domain-containing protein [Rhodocyclaceae bacterium]|nr:GGDEF domain-containing protein [Rhodocyclaceae bacterium]